jgi:hypothetical protein
VQIPDSKLSGCSVPVPHSSWNGGLQILPYPRGSFCADQEKEWRRRREGVTVVIGPGATRSLAAVKRGLLLSKKGITVFKRKGGPSSPPSITRAGGDECRRPSGVAADARRHESWRRSAVRQPSRTISSALPPPPPSSWGAGDEEYGV